MNKNIIIVAMITALVFGAGGFFGGVVYQKSKAVVNNFRQGGGFNGDFAGRMGGSRNGGNMMGNRPVLGQVVSKDDKSITVKVSDGSTKIVLLSSSTTFSKTDTGSLSDVKVGETVNVFGVANSDGTVTASNVLLNPALRGATNSAMPRYN